MSEASWWQRGLVYQIYPRSFQDSNGDGVGDLPGIISRLDYLAWLGVDAIWISPFFQSPQADFGYDISDHCSVDPLFGSLDDFDRLVAEAHRRHVRVILDYVPNHTSDRHPWFLDARSSRASPKRDWYIWKDPGPGGTLPNNWLSTFGGPAWTWDDQTGQYYYHSYLREQPDLDWRNPQVAEAMIGVLRFWLDRGVDGFRIDALRKVMKDPLFRDNPPNPDWDPSQGPYKRLLTIHSASQPESHEVIRAMRCELDRYSDRMMIGELYEPLEKLMTYYGTIEEPECHLPFNFQLLKVPWNARDINALIARYEGMLPEHGWPNWVLGNHDKHRIASRIGLPRARVAAMLLLTLRGTPTLYYGDELGLPDLEVPPELVQDPWEKNVPGLGLGRDPGRAPMPWDSSKNAGFTSGTPWLPLNPGYESLCVEAQRADPASTLSLHRSLIELRRSEPALQIGDWRAIEGPDSVVAFVRSLGPTSIFVALNLDDAPVTLRLDDLRSGGTVIACARGSVVGRTVSDPLELEGDQGLVVRLAAQART